MFRLHGLVLLREKLSSRKRTFHHSCQQQLRNLYIQILKCMEIYMYFINDEAIFRNRKPAYSLPWLTPHIPRPLLTHKPCLSFLICDMAQWYLLLGPVYRQSVSPKSPASGASEAGREIFLICLVMVGFLIGWDSEAAEVTPQPTH